LFSKKQTVVVTAGLQQVQARMAFICSHLLIEGLFFQETQTVVVTAQQFQVH
jgi:hypothetical protein